MARKKDLELATEAGRKLAQVNAAFVVFGLCVLAREMSR